MGGEELQIRAVASYAPLGASSTALIRRPPGHEWPAPAIVTSSTAVPSTQSRHRSVVTSPATSTVVVPVHPATPANLATPSRTGGYDGGSRCKDFVGSPPANGTLPSASPWTCRSETGCDSAQPSNTSVAATGAIAAIRSLASHASRYAIIPPFEIPVTKTRRGSVP